MTLRVEAAISKFLKQVASSVVEKPPQSRRLRLEDFSTLLEMTCRDLEILRSLGTLNDM
jgi:hypothetical protein